MKVCSPTCRKWSVYILSFLLLLLGILIVVYWGSIYVTVLKQELALGSSSSSGFNLWKETPIPMYIQFYLFNWTNTAAVLKNWKIKPVFEECGPYTFTEHHVRVNVTWNDNGTLSYYQKRIWKFVPEESSGSLTDVITNLNVIVATVGYLIRHEHYLVRRGVNFFIKEKEKGLVISKTVDELLFTGYDDELLELVSKLNISRFKIPFDKFGWFYSRNESATYDGLWNVHNGVEDINNLGLVDMWNGAKNTPAFEGTCGYCNGSSSGELFPPVKDYENITIFTPDLCSTIPLKHDKTRNLTLHGIEGKTYVCDASVFDNGTKYPEMGCFSPGIKLPSGVRNVSECRFGAPAFASFPHFYLADPSYRDAIVGMSPDKNLHEMFISLEPNTGIPLNVDAKMQVNLLIQRVHGIDVLEHVPTVMIPMLWFKQTAILTPTFADLAKILILLPSIGNYTGYGIIAIGALLLVCAIIITLRKSWKGSGEEPRLLSQESL